ncbi:MAG: PTS sugar transporter subunit IIB [Deltaproteobacteria bacterium]|jgi:PTS system mannose-specific IIB component|nr:PTS sugar transporter subunit IIB [Deltaproteobacteria bacterium]
MSLLATRVDQKLTHGQVLIGWVPFLKITLIFVVDDQAEKDDSVIEAQREMIRTGCEIADVEVDFVDSLNLPAKLNKRLSLDPTSRVMILFSDVAGVARAKKAGLSLSELNLGFYIYDVSDESLSLFDSFKVSRRDFADLTDLVKAGVKVFYQPLPRHSKRLFDPKRYQWNC